MEASPSRRLRGALVVLGTGCFGQSTLDGHQIPTKGDEPSYDDDTPPPVQSDGSIKCELSSVPAAVTLSSVGPDFTKVPRAAGKGRNDRPPMTFIKKA